MSIAGITSIPPASDLEAITLNVNATTVGNPPSMCLEKVNYLDMNASNGGVARDTLVFNTAWVTVFSYTGSGLILGWTVSTESNGSDWLFRFVVDGLEVFGAAGMKTEDITDHALYGLGRNYMDMAAGGIGMNLKTSPLYWQAPLNIPLCYKQNLSILIRRAPTKSEKKFKAGLMVITKAT